MDPEKRNKILNGWKTFPISSVANFVDEDPSLFADMQKTVITPKDSELLEQLEEFIVTRREEKNQQQQEADDNAWEDARLEGKAASYRLYLEQFPEGRHKDDAVKKLNDMDLQMWQNLKGKPSREGIQKYLTSFPHGNFINECRAMLEDMPWYETVARDTIAAYKEYKSQYPGKHAIEIAKRISEIEDEQDWKTACDNNTRDAYDKYLEQHPGGKYRDKAIEKINYRGKKEIFLDKLRDDPNALSAYQIQMEIDNGTANWYDLEEVYTLEQVEAIRSYRKAADLPEVEVMKTLPRGYTEVYFWGTRGTGKTCAIGATLGYLTYKLKTINPLNCPAEVYLYQLQHMFTKEDSICKLPPGTVMGNLPVMPFDFKDEKRNGHRCASFIDVAGEVFSGIFKKNQGMQLSDDEEKAVDDLTRCLTNHYNNKIHFFIIEYDNDDFVMTETFGEGAVSKSNVMNSLTSYFAKSKLFDKSSVGMYVLVTKCDKIPANQNRNEKVKEYITSGLWGNVVENIQEISKKANCGGLTVINFSIGDVFAKDLCIFNPKDASKIVNELIEHTPIHMDTAWGKFLDWFRK